MDDREFVTCFLSHKCNPQNHAITSALVRLMEPHGIELWVDHFEQGDVIKTRIHTVSFDGFLFIYSLESWSSAVCREELAVARERAVPVFLIRLEGEVPPELRERPYFDLSTCRLNNGLVYEQLEALGIGSLIEAISSRSCARKLIERLNPRNDAERALAAAQFIATEMDQQLVAEFARYIATFYTPAVEICTRFWIALALGRAGTCEALECLDTFGWEHHPYPLDGIRQAKEMIRGVNCSS